MKHTRSFLTLQIQLSTLLAFFVHFLQYHKRSDTVPFLHPIQNAVWIDNLAGRYHGDRRPSSDDSIHSIPPSALDKASIMKRYPSSANDEVKCDCTLTDDGDVS